MPLDTPDEIQAARAAAADLLRRREAVVARPLDRQTRGSLVEIDRGLAEILAGHVVDPCDASPDVPLVLLPVRVETKAIDGVLKVRITPDEIHVDALARTLTSEEEAAAKEYWQTMWMDAASSAAWSALVEKVGVDRAGWAARALTPTNLPSLGNGDPAFPAAPAEVTGGTVARCLPDRFIVRVSFDDGTVKTESGNPVPTDLPISPIALGDEDVVDLGGLRVPAGAEWTVDFTKAKDVGLGIEVALPPGTTRIASLVVVGTRSSVPEAANARDLSELMVSHAYSDGFELLAPGTPTNNADMDRSPYRAGATAGKPATVAVAASDEAASVARLLGVQADLVESLLSTDHARSSLESTQRNANTSLWWATWEFVLHKIDQADVPAVTPATIESARRLHRDHVRGAGHASAIRVGAQPYGVLPVADLDAWRPRRGELTASFVPLVARIAGRWARRAETLSHVGPGDEVSDAAMLEMLGMSPVSTGLRARPAVDGPQVRTLAAATGLDPSVVSAEAQVLRAMLAQYSPDLAIRLLPPTVLDETRRIALPLVSDRDAEVIAQILADDAPQVDSVLQALLDIAWDEAKAAQFRAAPSTYLPPLIDLLEPGIDITDLVTAAQSEAPISAAVHAAPADDPQVFYAAAQRLRSNVHFDGQPTEALSIAAIEPITEARTSLAQIALDLGDSPKARWIGQEAVASLLDAFAMRWEASEAMTALGAAPIEERRMAVASALDIASHRVDAWATGIAHERLTAGRAGEGITIGAFGYVENIWIGTRGQREGWVHAPSTSHAVAAGILASAHQSKIGAKPGTEPFAIDLSSRRGVELRRVLEGMRQGQTIGALLGYQIERGLTGSSARFQLTLRQLAPLNTDEVENDAASAERTARMAAADVVDGVDLLRQFPLASLDENPSPLRQKLDAPPLNAYVQSWDPVAENEWTKVKTAIRGAAETLDALSDALLAESVLQYVSGNPARASAAMDAVGAGGSVDPELAVLGVRQGGRSLTHNAFALIPEDAAGWSTTRARAVAEPRLEGWAARRLGSPSDIVVSDGPAGRVTLADTHLAALDLVFTDDLAALERELRLAVPDMGALATERGADWPPTARPISHVATLASTLRAMASGATVVTPSRLVAAGNDVQHTIDRDDLIARCAALLVKLTEALQSGKDVIDAIDQLSRAVGEDEVDAVRAAVAPLAAFGVTLTPTEKVPTDVSWACAAWDGASARLVTATAMLADLRAAADPTDAEVLDRATAIAECILGDGFRLLPVLRRIDGAPDDLDRALNRSAFDPPSRARVKAFVRDHGTVHAGMARLAEAGLVGGALGAPVELTVAQLTHVTDTGEPEEGCDRWLAGDLPDGVAWPAHPAIHLVLELVGAPARSTSDIAGLLIDSWVETLPFQPDPKAVAPEAVDTPLRDARATTGLAVQARQASARAPQVILSAVSADGARWTTDSVVRVVESAIALSKARLVTYEKVPGDAAILPAIYAASPWLQGRKGLRFADVATIEWSRVAYPFLSEVE